VLNVYLEIGTYTTIHYLVLCCLRFSEFASPGRPHDTTTMLAIWLRGLRIAYFSLPFIRVLYICHKMLIALKANHVKHFSGN